MNRFISGYPIYRLIVEIKMAYVKKKQDRALCMGKKFEPYKKCRHFNIEESTCHIAVNPINGRCGMYLPPVKE